jgi:hypothetical protein
MIKNMIMEKIPRMPNNSSSVLKKQITFNGKS